MLGSVIYFCDICVVKIIFFMAKRQLKNITTKLDKKTGELVEVEKTFNIKVKGSEHFYMTFIDYVNPIFELPRGKCRDLLVRLCCMAEWNTGIVRITTNRKKELCESFSMSDSVYRNNIAALVSKNILVGKGGDYEINPQIFWKGDTGKREMALKNSGLSINIRFREEEDTAEVINNFENDRERNENSGS